MRGEEDIPIADVSIIFKFEFSRLIKGVIVTTPGEATGVLGGGSEFTLSISLKSSFIVDYPV